jgi:hypothetical protein
MADDSGFIVSESLTPPLNFRHGVGGLIVFKVKISGPRPKYVALQQKRGYSSFKWRRLIRGLTPKG